MWIFWGAFCVVGLGEWQVREFQDVSELEERIRYLTECGFVVSLKYFYRS